MKSYKLTITTRALLLTAFLLILVTGCGKKPEEDHKSNQKKVTVDYSVGLSDDGTVAGIKASDYITLGEYQSIPISSEKVSVTDDMVDRQIDQMMKEYETRESLNKDHEIKEGDLVTVSYSGKIKGKGFKGGSKKKFELVVGADSFLTGFDQQLIGHKRGETVEVTTAFPEVYPANPKIAGKEVVFRVKIIKTEAVVRPKLTNDFVKKNMSEKGISSISGLKDYVKYELKQNKTEDAIWSYMITHAMIEKLPEDKVDVFLKKRVGQMKSQAQEQGYKYSDYLNVYGYNSTKEFQEGIRSKVEEELEKYLIADLVAERENLVVTDDDVRDYFKKHPEYSYRKYQKIYGSSYLKRIVLDDLVIDYLSKRAIIQ
ncbi:MAG: FKBP-type peptidyl-prolyl cis-trans isomerase [Lachnospiraceae bacterium]|nr:FKBP-type peptidyl-prolyl cis-trans isomerase [Lachnospiraceae bacterium]